MAKKKKKFTGMKYGHHPRLYQVAEQEFQKTNWKLYLLVGFRILTTGNLFFFCTNKMLQASSYY